MLMLDGSPTNRRPRERSHTDEQEDKRNPHALRPGMGSRESPDDEIVQALHAAGEEAVEASDDQNVGVGRGADPDEEEDGCEPDAGDDCVEGAEETV